MKITPKTKKLLIMNIPYFIIFFAFWRIHSLYPILPYNSALAALAGSAVIRLAVYVNGKDAKKYRKNVEYGSARWSA